MNEKFCDQLADELEVAFAELGSDVYKNIKELMRTMRGLGQHFGRGVFNRDGLKRALLKKPELSEMEKAQLLGIIRMLPVLTHFGVRGLGQPDVGGKVPQMSHELREKIRADAQKPMEGETISAAVRRLAIRHGISERNCWNILSEDAKSPEYWESEILRKVRESKISPAE
jgi:hypothetical protein